MRYEGNFKENEKNGLGTEYDMSGNVYYKGMWKNNQMDGYGMLCGDTEQGEKYEGEFREGLYDG